MAHIYRAPAGDNGPIVVWLYPEDGPPSEQIDSRFNGILAEDTITDADLVGPQAGDSLDDLITAIRAGETYVNVHTEPNPSGEVRGQIH